MNESLTTLLTMLQCPACQAGEITRIPGAFPEVLPL